MMSENNNKYMALSYKLFTQRGQETPELVEEATEEVPFTFVTGMGMTLDAFESQMEHLQAGSDYDFTLSVDEAYGEYDEAGRQTVSKSMFEIEGKIDSRYIYEGAIVPLTSGDGSRFNGLIAKIDDDTITVDLNHPLAGKTLNFVGRVIECRPASEQEVKDAMKMLSGEGGCGGGCNGGGCNGGCESGGCSGCK